MVIHGFTGKSGTGKSHHAVAVAEEIGADCVIDDGLLISRGTVKAGYSAKFEPTQVAAVRRAVFLDAGHREQVRQSLALLAPAHCLILGTSREMVRQIAVRLELPTDEIEWISVDDVVSATDRTQAKVHRDQGMHAIPVLQAQVQPIGSLTSLLQRMLLRVRVSSAVTVAAGGPMIVRPLFADGGLYVHPRVIRKSLEYFLRDGQHPFRLRQLRCNPERTAVFELFVEALWQPDLTGAAVRVRREFTTFLQDNLGFPYPLVEIHIVSLQPPQETRRRRPI